MRLAWALGNVNGDAPEATQGRGDTQALWPRDDAACCSSLAVEDAVWPQTVSQQSKGTMLSKSPTPQVSSRQDMDAVPFLQAPSHFLAQSLNPPRPRPSAAALGHLTRAESRVSCSTALEDTLCRIAYRTVRAPNLDPQPAASRSCLLSILASGPGLLGPRFVTLSSLSLPPSFRELPPPACLYTDGSLNTLKPVAHVLNPCRAAVALLYCVSPHSTINKSHTRPLLKAYGQN
ncbi:hypothetical protein ANO11243_068280 [Dothideomycetidae sp. 11243]|nr:hypothetical protein ANO11243_068280 [fungal sp. No.11243]